MNHKKESTRNSLGRLLLILAMVIALVAGTALVGAQHADAADGDSGSTSSDTTVTKTVTANKTNGIDNGSYTLTLSATGKDESDTSTVTTPTDVVIVIDTSGSMGWNYYYQAITGSPSPDSQNQYYVSVDGNYVKLYYDDYYDKWYYNNTWLTNETVYTRQYMKQTRLAAAKASARSLVTKLTGLGSNVKVSIVGFDNTADVKCGFTNTANTLNQAINNLSAGGGTNWEDGLTKAQSQLNQTSESSVTNKNVIFISDGDPTFRNDGQGGHTGTGNSDPYGLNFNAANSVAKSIRDSGAKLYTVNAFGDADKMSQLHNDGSYQANNQTQLENVFNQIVKSITNSSSTKSIVVHDTLTTETDSSATTKTANYSGTASEFVYKATDKNGNDVTSSHTIPKANIGDDGKTINWTPGDVPSGVTYSVSCTIWPSQEAYDKVAKKMNGESVSSMGNITGDNDKGYSVPTNAASNATYDEIYTTTQSDPTQGITGLTMSGDNYTYNGITLTKDEQSADRYTATDGSTLVKGADGKWTLTMKKSINPLGNGSMAIVPAKIHVKKVWKNVSTKPDSLTVQASADSSHTYSKLLTGTGDTWEGDIYVAPGLKVTKTVENSNEKQLNSTLTYNVTETGIDAGEYQTTYSDNNTGIEALINDGNINNPLANVTITNTKIIKTGVKGDNSRAPFAAAGIGLGALAVVFVLRRRLTHR
ncbi:MAG: VWA domain-containing protein [Pseudoramibacter sp.]